MKFVQLILRKIIKIVATRCQILRLKCTKFDFGWGETPLVELTALPQTPELDLRGLLLREGRGRKRGGGERGREGGEGREEGRGGDGRGEEAW